MPNRGASQKTRKTKKGQSEATQALLVKLARSEFARRGYAGVGLESLVHKAGLTRGALYHQFKDKKALFAAVLREVQKGISESIANGAESAGSEWEGLRMGCQAFLREASRPANRRILLIDGPSVLGWEAWRDLDYESGVAQLREGLADLMKSGQIRTAPVEPLALALSGAMNELALWISASAASSRDAALGQAYATLDRLLSGLLTGLPK